MAAELRRRLARLERTVAGVVPDPAHCPRCGGRPPIALSDEPGNAVSTYHPHARCPTCRSTPPPARALVLPPAVAGLFAGVPWSPRPLHRVLEKLMLWRALSGDDEHGAKRLMTLIYERAAGRQAATGGRDGGSEWEAGAAGKVDGGARGRRVPAVLRHAGGGRPRRAHPEPARPRYFLAGEEQRVTADVRCVACGRPAVQILLMDVLSEGPREGETWVVPPQQGTPGNGQN